MSIFRNNYISVGI